MRPVYIALGANLSNPKESFIGALKALSEKGVVILRVSGLWQSPAWPPGQGHPDYLNAVAAVQYKGKAEDLLTLIQSVELDFGRVRSVRNAPRTLDLDIIDFKGQILGGDRLSLPHPRMFVRGFVLFPLSEIAPHWQDPVSGERLESYIAQLPLSDVAPMSYQGRFYRV